MPGKNAFGQSATPVVVLSKVISNHDLNENGPLSEGEYFTVCTGHAAEMAKFYEENRSQMVRPCDGLVVLRPIASGNAFVMRAYAADGVTPVLEGQSTNIVASAMGFDIDIPVPSPSGARIEKFIEFGAMVSRQEGFGHQWTISAGQNVESPSLIPSAGTANRCILS